MSKIESELKGVLLSERLIPVPRSISPEAQAALAMERPPQPAPPALNDKAAWHAHIHRINSQWAPLLRAHRATLRRTESALPLRSADPLDGFDDDTFARLTRRALGHYGDLSKLVANPLTALPAIDERLAARGAPDQPLERAIELKALLADRIARLKPRDGADFGTTEQWRYYNSLYFPYVVGVRAYAQNATAAGLDPTARQAWQWFVTEVPQRSLHNWQNAAARLIAADLRGRVAVSS